MCPLSDDALLDWALAPGEADPAIERHLRECASCRSRSEAVRREQALLRSAFVEPKPSLRLEERLAPRPQGPLWARLGIAALLLMAITVGVLLTRTAGHTPHRGGSTGNARRSPSTPASRGASRPWRHSRPSSWGSSIEPAPPLSPGMN